MVRKWEKKGCRYEIYMLFIKAAASLFKYTNILISKHLLACCQLRLVAPLHGSQTVFSYIALEFATQVTRFGLLKEHS